MLITAITARKCETFSHFKGVAIKLSYLFSSIDFHCSGTRSKEKSSYCSDDRTTPSNCETAMFIDIA